MEAHGRQRLLLRAGVERDSASGGPASRGRALRWHHVAEHEAFGFDHLAGSAADRRAKDRSGVDEGVKLAALSARIDVVRQVGQERRVVGPPGEGAIQSAGIDANHGRPETGSEELAGEPGGVTPRAC